MEQEYDGLPASIRRQAEQMKKLEEANSPKKEDGEQVTDPQSAAVVVPPESENPNPVGGSNDAGNQNELAAGGEQSQYEKRIADLERDLADWKRRADVENGKAGRELDLLRRENAMYRQKLESSPAPEQARIPSQPVVSDIESAKKDLAATLGAFDNDTVEAILKAADYMAEKKFAKSQSMVDPVAKKVDAIETRSNADSLFGEIERLSPGFVALNGDPERNIPCDDRYFEFLDTPISADSTVSPRLVIEASRKAGRSEFVKTVASFVKQFQGKKPIVQQSITDGKNPVAHAKPPIAPPTSGGTNQPVASATPKKEPFKESTYRKAIEQAKRGTISDDDYNKTETEYLKALAEGRVLIGQ